MLKRNDRPVLSVRSSRSRLGLVALGDWSGRTLEHLVRQADRLEPISLIPGCIAIPDMITKMVSNLLFFLALLPFAFLLARELKRRSSVLIRAKETMRQQLFHQENSNADRDLRIDLVK